jgi:hypothetical protein
MANDVDARTEHEARQLGSYIDTKEATAKSFRITANNEGSEPCSLYH